MAPMDYLQYWYQSNAQQYQAEQVPQQHHQMVNATQYTEDKIMTDLAVHQDPYLEPPQQPHQLYAQPPAPPTTPAKGKKRGRPPKGEGKEKTEAEESAKKAKRTLDRFNGMSVEEVMARKLPDVITHNLDMLIIGINPGLLSAYKGRHYPNPGNHFWKCLFLSGLTEEQLNHMHDQTLPERYGIGFTNMVERTTPGSKDLSNKEIREGGHQLLEKLQKYRPLIAVFNGKCIYEIFCKEIFGVKAKNLEFGLQPYKVPETETVCYLMPSSSPRCAQFPRAQDKVHFFIKLKELRDQMKGVVRTQEVQETDYTFDVALAKEDAKRLAIKEEQHDPGYEETCAHGSQGQPQQEFGLHPSTDTVNPVEMDERLYGSLPHAPSEYLQQWVQSAQQHLQALQAQYPHMANGNAGFMMEGPREDGGMQQMPVHPEDVAQMDPAAVQKAKEDKDAPPAEGQEKIDETFKKVKRKVDRFKGMSEEEVMKKTLPDILTPNLDYVIIGINPGLMAAYIGRWFPGPGNHFWKCLFLSGFTEKLLNHMDDDSLPEKYGIGFTNMVARATPGSKDLSSKELREGGKILVEKIKKFKPLIAVFNGKCREIFGKKPKTLEFGLQPHKIPDSETALYLMPSSSARCAQFPRAQDKVHFYIKLRELRDELKGVAKPKEIEEVNYTFDLGMAKEDAKRMAIKEEHYDPGYEAAFGGAYGEPAPEGGQSNGYCNFSASEETAEKAPTNPNAVGQVQDGQWMTQSFADQIPDIGNSSQAQTWGV
ncbi:G T mismatch-specific thymine DNA glycosylase-like protein [Labeo rohita]|uniref:G/T mismatch-specific thymine DNA glycosylase n=1 Tax=Labeo rohita TaxID=84645 RepID=A0A498LFE1_LABRO|nr:G T mismatch-specific thymine DNA glycosylase-like protein [Labeo rohita]